MSSKREKMMVIKKELLEFKKSPLYNYRKENKYFPVVGEGDINSKVIFIGEAPGKNEALSGQPFCGASGRILDQLLESINIKRADVYITNIVKDRPPENRDPTPEEIELYAPFLDHQIEIIQPKIIATLGRFSMKYILKRFGLVNSLDTIGNLHGQFLKTKMSYGEVPKVFTAGYTPIMRIAQDAAVRYFGWRPDMPFENFIDTVLYYYFLEKGITLVGYVVDDSLKKEVPDNGS